jgi:hypothetical protein
VDGGTYSKHGGDKKCIRSFLVGKAEGNRPYGRTRRRWEVHIKGGLKEIGCKGVSAFNWLGTGSSDGLF